MLIISNLEYKRMGGRDRDRARQVTWMNVQREY